MVGCPGCPGRLQAGSSLPMPCAPGQQPFPLVPGCFSKTDVVYLTRNIYKEC